MTSTPVNADAGEPPTPDAGEDIDDRLLRDWPLPEPAAHADKQSRGAVLVVGGSREVPGALLLAATAALRAGAGKLLMATGESVARHVAAAMPEARVVGLPESEAGGLLAQGAERLAPYAPDIDALLLGPGLIDAPHTVRFVHALLPHFAHAPVLLDALAMDVVLELGRFPRPVLLTPHAGEMAHLCGFERDEVLEEGGELAARWARRWNAVLAVKGPCTHIATPEGRVWKHAGHDPGLGTSGSGDVLAGIGAGLLARGATLAQACVWAVRLHAHAGRRAARRVGAPLGYLARELPAEVPGCLHLLSAVAPVTDYR